MQVSARWLIVALDLGLLAVGCGFSAPRPAEAPVYQTSDGVRFRVEVVARNLEIPWSLAFTPDGRLLFTERPGRLRAVENGRLRPEPLATIREVVHEGEGGLMGLALDPAFERDHYLYLCYTYQNPAGGIENRVARYRESPSGITDPKILIDKIPGAEFHDGCRLRFGPDGKLYITTGDATKKQIAQDLHSLGGKILRILADGSIPADNPLPGSPVYSYGHRNPQGIDWQPTAGLLFETEHGPSVFDAPGGGDEVNIVEPGKNYGWPVIHHRMRHAGMESPLLEYTPAIAPSGASFYRGSRFPAFRNNFFFATLRGEHLHRVVLDSTNPRVVRSEERLLEEVYGRIRDVVEAPDGALYFCTSNRDGRAEPTADDDRILRIVPAK